jgi:hypothetical protein
MRSSASATKAARPYAASKTLAVFLEAGAAAGAWHPNRLGRGLPDPLHFATVWVVALQKVEDGAYVYAVTNLDVSDGVAPTLLVRIGKEFDAWDVVWVQRPPSGLHWLEVVG